jgi:hypothetical protein
MLPHSPYIRPRRKAVPAAPVTFSSQTSVTTITDAKSEVRDNNRFDWGNLEVRRVSRRLFLEAAPSHFRPASGKQVLIFEYFGVNSLFMNILRGNAGGKTNARLAPPQSHTYVYVQ